ncbi:MAG TPA: cell surface protein [Deinococcales bacterium]|nr:cell surface protein [Deinococcales bacterium]
MKHLALLALAVAGLAACAPTAERPALRPVITKVSVLDATAQQPSGASAGAPGQTVEIQGRDLGGPGNSAVWFRADERGNGGVRNDAADIVSWTPSDIVLKVPAKVTPGGGFVVVEVGGVKSLGLPFSIAQ